MHVRSRTLPAAAVALLGAGTVAWAPAANSAHEVYRVEAPGEYYGWAISELADVDGDGVTDWVAGAVFAGGQYGGATEVRSGRTGDLLYRWTGAPGELEGYAIADVGDVDGDGTHDIASGAPGIGTAGTVYVHSGADGSLLDTLTGEVAPDFFGAAVGDAGDVNDDGHADLLVGATDTAEGGTAYVISGADGTTLRTYHAPASGSAFGSATDAAGDITGDGIPEHLIGASNAGPEARGAAYLFDGATGELIRSFDAAPEGNQFGSFFVAGVGDVDGDGVPDQYVGDYADDTGGTGAGSANVYSGADGTLLHRFVGHEGDGMGPGRAAGDLDRDGHPDLIVGSYTHGTDGAGAATVFSGRTGDALLTITSDVAGENLGFDAVGLGDATGDGKDDLLVSAASGDRVYLYRGPGVRHDGRN